MAQRARERTARSERRARRRATRIPLPAALVILGIVCILPVAGMFGIDSRSGDSAYPWMVFGALAAISTIGASLAGRGYRVGVLSLLIVPLALASVVLAGLRGDRLSFAVGNSVEQPTRLSAEQTYRNGVGTSLIDLRGVTASSTPDRATVHASTTTGTMTIWVPDGVRAEVTTTSSLGTVEVQNAKTTRISSSASIDGTTSRFTVGSGPKTLVIDARTGIGTLTIRTENPNATVTETEAETKS